jgi:hypothetical protein
MQYKTIVLELLEQHPALMEALRSQRILLASMESYASELKISHEAWKEQLNQSKPESNPLQIASEALELALEQFQNRLPSELEEMTRSHSPQQFNSGPDHMPPE